MGGKQSSPNHTCLLYGTLNCGKTLLFNFFKTKQERYQPTEIFDRDLLSQQCILLIKSIVKSMTPTEYFQFNKHMLKQCDLEWMQICFHLLHDEIDNGIDGTELIVKLWNVTEFREFYLKKWLSGDSEIPDNVELLVHCILNRKCDLDDGYCLKLMYSRSGYDTKCIINRNLRIMDDNGMQRFRGSDFTFSVKNISILLVVISLSEFNQKTGAIDVLKNSIEAATEAMNSNELNSRRKIIIFTKVDIFVSKLARNVEYVGELDTNIRPELHEISQERNANIIVNTIMTRVLKDVDPTTIESFHFVNTTLDSELEHVWNEMCYPTKTNYISPCLRRNILAKNTLKLRVDRKCTDITLITN